MKSLYKKVFVFIFLSLGFNAAFACPDFSGSWVCKTIRGGVFDTTFSQKIVGNTTLYKLGITEFVSDGNIHQVDGATYVSSCQDDGSVKLNIESVVVDMTSGKRIGTAHYNYVFKKPEAEFQATMNGDIHTDDNNATEPIKDGYTCKKKVGQ